MIRSDGISTKQKWIYHRTTCGVEEIQQIPTGKGTRFLRIRMWLSALLVGFSLELSRSSIFFYLDRKIRKEIGVSFQEDHFIMICARQDIFTPPQGSIEYFLNLLFFFDDMFCSSLMECSERMTNEYFEKNHWRCYPISVVPYAKKNIHSSWRQLKMWPLSFQQGHSFFEENLCTLSWSVLVGRGKLSFGED